MKSSTFFLSCLVATVAANKVVQLDVRGPSPSEAIALQKRAATIDAYLLNSIQIYTVNVSIGTPGQSFQLQLDTGSSDVWVNAADSEFCKAGNCSGSFDASSSSSFAISAPGAFNISYADLTSASGDYFTDVVDIGGVSITNQTMGLANVSDIPVGLVGVGFAGNEASCGSAVSYCYPSIIDSMVSQGKINSHAFSLYLNDLNESTGSILFGGVDSARYVDSLTALPIVNVDYGNDIVLNTTYSVAFTNLTITTPNGVEQISTGDLAAPVLLDSGNSYSNMPSSLANPLFEQFGAVALDGGNNYAPCYLREANATIDFHLGGSDGFILKVPVREFLITIDSDLNNLLQDLGNNEYCLVAISATDDDSPTFGDVILRSAYIVYDLDNRVIAMAQAKFSPGESDIKEITNATASNIPGVSKTASGAPTILSATGSVTDAEPVGATALSSGADASLTSGVTSAGTPPLAQFTTASYTGQDAYSTATAITTAAGGSSGSGGNSSSSGAANSIGGVRVGALSDRVVAVVMVGLAVLFGTGMIVL